MHAATTNPAGAGARSSPSSRPVPMSPWLALRLLEDLQDLPAAATGALVFGDVHSPIGTILLEGGRVCWASAQHMPHRLTDLIRRQADPPLPRATLETAYRQCRREGRPIGEFLVSRQLVQREGLRQALRQHTAEAIGVIASASVRERTWLEHARRRYDAEFTFSVAEILSGVGALSLPDLARRAEAQLGQALALGGCGMGFARDGNSSGPVPLAVHGCGEIGAAEVMALGYWIASTLDLCGAFTTRTNLVIAGDPRDGGGMLCWREQGVELGVLCEDHSTLAYVTATRARRWSAAAG